MVSKGLLENYKDKEKRKKYIKDWKTKNRNEINKKFRKWHSKKGRDSSLRKK